MDKFGRDGVSGYVQTRLLPDIILSVMPRLRSINSMSSVCSEKHEREEVDNTSKVIQVSKFKLTAYSSISPTGGKGGPQGFTDLLCFSLPRHRQS